MPIDPALSRLAGIAAIQRVAAQASRTPAHDVTTTVAPFRAWRGSQLIIAGGPERATIARAAHYANFYRPLQAPAKPVGAGSRGPASRLLDLRQCLPAALLQVCRLPQQRRPAAIETLSAETRK